MRRILLTTVKGRSLFFTLLLACFSVTGLQAQAFSGSTEGPEAAIPDNAYDPDAPDLADMASQTLELSGIPAGAGVQDLSISVKLNHTWVGDVTVFVEAPTGDIITLFDKPGTDTGFGDSSDFDENSPISFSDDSANDPEDMGSTILGGEVVCQDDEVAGS